MEARSQVSDEHHEDIISTQLPYDIFADNSKGTTVFKRFFKAIQYAAVGFRRQSTLVTTYYYDVLNWKTKADTRFTLLVVMGLLMLHIAEYGLASSLPSAFPFEAVSILVVSTFLIHLLTFRKLTHATYTNISLLIALGTMWINCWARCRLVRRSTRMYLPTFLLIFITVLFLPIPFDSGLLIIVGQCVTLLLLREHEREQVKKTAEHTNHTKNHHPMFDTFRLSGTPNTALMSSRLMLGQEILLCALIYLVAVYVAMWNQLRRRFVFNRLATNVRMRKAMTKALDDKIRWIEAIMPSQVTAEFYQLYKQYSNNDSHMWVYNKALDNVTILFADMVGFTRMSSNKTATQLVMLLNDLFSRFDELCQLTHCEKIGTLGDCYYCVAGCPEPRADHAESCVEMGLGMCRIIKVFNYDHSEQVNMRVGIHTGRVNAAIIGKQRFRYDVYSYDVSIANAMESSGRPGRVHISEETFERVKHVYNVSCGEDLYVKKEEMLGIAGMALAERAMKTYFVDPRSSLIRRRHEKFGKKTNVRSKASWIAQLDDDSDSSSSVEDNGCETKRDSTIRRSKQPFRTPLSRCREKNKDDLEHLERQIELIHDLQTDPERQIAFFRVPPLHPYLFQFLNAEIEWHYRHHSREIRAPTYIDAKKASSIADACVLAIVNVIVLTICTVIQVVCVDFETVDLIIYTCVFATAIALFFALLLSATFYQDQLKPGWLKAIHRILSGLFVQEVILSVLCLCPTLYFLNLRYSLGDRVLFSEHTYIAVHLAGVCLIVHCLPISSAYLGRTVSCLITLIITEFISSHETAVELCVLKSEDVKQISWWSVRYLLLFEMLFSFVLITRIARENERISRLCFYVTREMSIASDLSQIAEQDAQKLLFNIIPEYIYRELKCAGQGDLSHGSFSYAVSLQNVGVSFACISNFFSGYYREDYKGGEASLRLLNSIICTFDELLERPELKDVEKIKTINDCYMVAAGLNYQAIKKNENKQSHLISLMHYCHLLKESLDEFNDKYIIGTENFVVKIGYNFGPVTAGIIGTTKPFYDIWGDTVNVASRMYSTGLPGEIQVPETVIPVLEYYFDFHYRGDIFVKGKGDMRTYVCKKKL
ncbi:hypothetical protein CRM22_001674 [Opisthorchis felineus]|uniref:Adenylate cyclase type 9 n=1 Tax=Opisthorchis felineus TaxID=147828 RepID=A0A4S2M9J2_OPIFE|nr:hypothetical protein CRM22_001674 [Opisthorchis felineus]